MVGLSVKSQRVFKQLNFLQKSYYQIVNMEKVFHFVSLVFCNRLIINLLGQKSVSGVSSVSHARETA
jgi:hypothetical protein